MGSDVELGGEAVVCGYFALPYTVTAGGPSGSRTVPVVARRDPRAGEATLMLER